MLASNVPGGWWQEACERVRHPLACVGTDHTFVWVNTAFERLVGYSVAELADMTWMDITDQADVGGDLASVKSVIDGRIPQYTITKRYRHKHGRLIPIELSVWRFPSNTVENLVCFIVEAAPETASTQQLVDLRRELTETINSLRAQIEGDRPTVTVSNNVGDNVGGDKTGRDKITRTESGTFILAGVLLAIVSLLGYMAYVATWPNHRGHADPPRIEGTP